MAGLTKESRSLTDTVTRVAIELTNKGLGGAELNNHPEYVKVKKQTVSEVFEAIKKRIEESLKN